MINSKTAVPLKRRIAEVNSRSLTASKTKEMVGYAVVRGFRELFHHNIC